MAWVKFIEAIAQGRPRAIWRLLLAPDPEVRAGIRWYYRHGRLVWPYEIWNFLFKDRTRRTGPTVAQFWGAPQDHEENALAREKVANARLTSRAVSTGAVAEQAPSVAS
jgi:anaerobic magnesium-protoporphyrin IX monomethyl ester cyclase